MNSGEMRPLKTDLSVLKKLDLEYEPVGVKFLYNRPKGIPRLEKKLGLCEMLPEAHKGKAFYADEDSHECAGPLVLGLVEMEPFFEAGQLGPRLEIFQEARANRRLYQDIPKLKKGSCNYVVFAPLSALNFEPDVLVITGKARQAEIVLRSLSYSTGRKYLSKGTPVLGCAWTFIYPYNSGEVNFSVSGLTFGHIAREVLPEGLVTVSIPFDVLMLMMANLNEMKWVLPAYTEGRDNYNERFKRETSNTSAETG
jgi:uncharacterized protein (DUF169 family)